MRGRSGFENVAEEWVTSAEEVERVGLSEDEQGTYDANDDAGHPEQKHEGADDC